MGLNRDPTTYCVTSGQIKETFLAEVNDQQIRDSCSYTLG